eukprot:53325_1
MLLILTVIVCWFKLYNVNANESANISISLDFLSGITSDYFVSFTFGTGGFTVSPPVNFTSTTFQYMAKQLNPAILRLGGTSADKVYYFTDEKTGNCDNVKLPSKYYCFTKQNLLDLVDFVKNVGCKLIFALSIGYPTYPNSETNAWNSSNAEIFINYIVNNNYGQYFYGFEIGNELSTHAHTNASFQVDAFKQLKLILKDTFGAKHLAIPFMAGPDSDGSSLRGSQSNSHFKYIEEFVESACDIVDIFTYHCYTDVNSSYLLTLNGINQQYKESKKIHDIVAKYCPNGNQSIFAGEIAEHDHGGIDGYNNKYEDSIWYLNAFGALSLLNQQSLIRQKIYSYKQPPDAYVLLTDINGQKYMPLPDYWIAVLFNNLIGKNVLNTTTNYDYLKINAFCYAGNNGSVILAYVNLKNEIIDIVYNVASLGVNHMDYILTAKDNELNSADIYLNGVNLQVNNDHELPELNGNLSNSSPIQIQPYSVGLIHFVDTKSAMCL